MNGAIVEILPKIEEVDGLGPGVYVMHGDEKFALKAENVVPIEGTEKIAPFHEGLPLASWRPGPSPEQVVQHPGAVDEQGVLWKSSSYKRLTVPEPGLDHAWALFAKACETHGSLQAMGERAVVQRVVDSEGREKFEMGEYSFITYAKLKTRVDAIGSGLASLPGVRPGAKLIIYAETQMRWMLTALAAWRQGLVVGTIYATLGEEGAQYGINQSQSAFVVADGKLLATLGNIAADCPRMKRVIVFKEEDMDGGAVAKCRAAGVEVTPLATLEKLGEGAPKPPTPATTADVAVLMYTSGTTGKPKGVLLTHGNVAALVTATLSQVSCLGSMEPNGAQWSPM